MPNLRITKVETFLTQPDLSRHAVVKVHTSEPGLYGLGDATFTQRHQAVKAMLDHHLCPFAVGRDPRDIEDFWQTAMVNGYWRNGPVVNCAVSGIDMALWDIKGKLAGMPCCELWGGKCRPAAAVYVHAGGSEPAEVIDSARGLMARGFRHVRCQLGGYVGLQPGAARPVGVSAGVCYEPRQNMRMLPEFFERLRLELGQEVELIHDVHERLSPCDAVWLAKAMEPYRLFFLEDLFAPEDAAWLRQVRAVCATPIAMGELFVNPAEFVPVIADRLIDFIRVHVAQIGGVTPAIKLMHLAGAFGVRTAWHGPGDLSPVGVAANLHLDLAAANFGIRECCPTERNAAEQEMFPGTPQVREGFMYPNDRPGLGVEFDEALAAKFPCDDKIVDWTVLRTPDGTARRP